MKTKIQRTYYKAIISLLFAFFFIFTIACTSGEDAAASRRTNFKFNPGNPDHIQLTVTDGGTVIPNSTSLGETSADGNPLIIVSSPSLVNTGASNIALAIPGVWTLSVTPIDTIFTTSSPPILIDDPEGFAAITIDLPETITVTNLNNVAVPNDDEVVTYNVRVVFLEGEGGGTSYGLNIITGGSTTAIEPNDMFMVTTACQSFDYQLTINGEVTMDYYVKIATYYDRSLQTGLGAVTASDNRAEVSVTQSPEILSVGDNQVVGTFTFTAVFTACLEQHLGTDKTGFSANAAFEISNAQHLEVIAYLVNKENIDYKTVYFKIMQPIDLEVEGAPWSKAIGGTGFSSIGQSNGVTPGFNEITGGFGGELDCMGHVISNLYINDPNADDRGLFGVMGDALSRSGVVRNCRLENVDISARNNVGAFGGKLTLKSSILDSYVTGKVSGNDKIGGLVGNALASVISNSYSAATVEGNNYVGGLMGHMQGVIPIGLTDGSSSIASSYSSGNVTGRAAKVGGLVGEFNNGVINNVYATGSVNGQADVGGLVGNIGNIDTTPGGLSNSYYSGNPITAPADALNIGAIAGYSGKITIYTYWPSDYTTGATEGVGGGSSETKASAIARTRDQLQVNGPVLPTDPLSDPDPSVYINWQADHWSFGTGRYPVLKNVVCANRQYQDPAPDTCTDTLPQ